MVFKISLQDDADYKTVEGLEILERSFKFMLNVLDFSFLVRLVVVVLVIVLLSM